MTTNMKKATATIFICILILFSFFYLGNRFSQVESYSSIVESLDAKKQTVLKLTAATTAASATVTLLPGDIATPIAEKLVDYSNDFLIVLTAIYLEKYLLTIIGFAAFKVIIPCGLGLYLLDLLFNRERTLQRISTKLVLFGLLITLVIPVSVKISDMIENTYHQMDEKVLTEEVVEESETVEEEQVEESSIWDMFTNAIYDTLDNIAESATEATTTLTEETTLLINKFIESVAIMLVTSCAIPVLVILAFIWLTKVILEVNIPVIDPRKLRTMIRQQSEETM